MQYFPDFVPPQAQVELEALTEQYRLLKLSAIRNPIKPPHTLRILHKYHCPTKHSSVIAGISVPARFRQRSLIFDVDFSEGKVEVILTDPIQVGEPRWAQVWRARLRSQNPSLEEEVVIKLYHPGLAPKPRISMPYDDRPIPPTNVLETSEGSIWSASSEMARTEAWAYECLHTLQGTAIPWSYGFYSIEMPGGEAVIAHIMEYVRSTNVMSFFEEHRSDISTLWECCDALTETVWAINSLGVIHFDIRPQNVLMTSTDPPAFVIVDFGIARTRWFDDADCRDWDARGVYKCILDFDRQQDMATFDQWLDQREEAWDYFFNMYTGRLPGRESIRFRKTPYPYRIPPDA